MFASWPAMVFGHAPAYFYGEQFACLPNVSGREIGDSFFAARGLCSNPKNKTAIVSHN